MMRRFDGAVGIAGGSVTRKLWPAIVRLAVRVTDVEFDAAVNVTRPEPFPVLPLLIVIHDEVLVVDHEQPADVVTVTLMLLPVPAMV